MKENYRCISPNYEIGTYYQLPCIDRYLSGAEWKLFTVLFNHIMTVTKHDKIKNESVKITHDWLADMLGGKDRKTSQRNVKKLQEWGVVKVKKADYQSNIYELNWDVINTLARCQIEKKDKNVALSEVKNVLYIEDIIASHTEVKNVSQIIKNNKTINKTNNKGNTKSAGTKAKSVQVSATELDGVIEMVLSSDKDRLAEARNKPNRALNTSVAHNPSHIEQQPQHNPNSALVTTTAHSHNPIEGDENAPIEQHNLQFPSVLLSPQVAAHPPLTDREEEVIKYCDKYYNNGSSYVCGELENVCSYLNHLIETEGEQYNSVTLSKIETTAKYLRLGIDRGYFV